MRDRASKIWKLVGKGVLFCAPFLLFLASVILASVWMFQIYVANNPLYRVIVNDAPSGTVMAPTHTVAPPVTQPSVTTDTPEEAFPVIKYGSNWGTINVEGWKRKDIPLWFGDTKKMLRNGACMSIKSSFCGQGGRTVVSAHVNSFFKELEDVKLGDIVTVETAYGTYRYEVIDSFVFHYQDDSAIFDTHTDKTNLLFMYTCYPRKNSYAFKEQRLGVIAKMIEGKDWSVNAGE